MRILGIDPGLTRCGVGVVELLPGRKVTLIDVTVLRTPATLSLTDRIARIAGGIDELIVRHHPAAIAMERVFARRDVSTVMATAQVSGAAHFVAAQRGLSVHLYTPTEVKAAVTGYGAAAKPQVGALVARLLGVPQVPGPPDAADALAIAISHAFRGASDGRSFGRDSLGRSGPSDEGAQTRAQKSWRAAEAAAARPRRRPSLGV